MGINMIQETLGSVGELKGSYIEYVIPLKHIIWVF